MKFNDYWGHEPETKPLAPDGTHFGEIVEAKEKRLPFMVSDFNRDGACIVCTIDLGKYQPLEAIIPANYRGKIEALAKAAGVPLPGPEVDWDVSSLVGRSVSVETSQAVSKKGTQYVRIDKWMPNPSQPLPASKPAAARSQSAKASRSFSQSSTNSDDVPF